MAVRRKSWGMRSGLILRGFSEITSAYPACSNAVSHARTEIFKAPSQLRRQDLPKSYRLNPLTWRHWPCLPSKLIDMGSVPSS
jgi:hypothetical protein